MPVNPNVIGPATLSMTQSLSLFDSFLPSFRDISKADPGNEGIVRDVRMGELAAVLMTLGIGGMTSALTGSSVPAVVALVTCGGLVLLYETALRSTGETVNTNA
jgi:hypothetical protein